jgi:hypothetical protein
MNKPPAGWNHQATRTRGARALDALATIPARIDGGQLGAADALEALLGASSAGRAR